MQMLEVLVDTSARPQGIPPKEDPTRSTGIIIEAVGSDAVQSVLGPLVQPVFL